MTSLSSTNFVTLTFLIKDKVSPTYVVLRYIVMICLQFVIFAQVRVPEQKLEKRGFQGSAQYHVSN